MQITSALEKLFSSIINAGVVLLISIPIYLLYGFNWKWKILTLALFFVYETMFLLTKDKQDLGMLALGSHWKKPFTNNQYILYNLFYTLSFSTLLFHLLFPFDLLLLNLIIIQLPLVTFTGYTLHGYLSGMVTVK